MSDFSNSRYSQMWWVPGALLCVLLHCQNVDGQRRKKADELSPVLLEYALTADEFLQLDGKLGTAQTTNGATYPNVRIEKVRLDRGRSYPSSISLAEPDSKRSRRVPIRDLARLTIAETVYEPEYVGQSRQYLLIDVNQRDAAATQRLRQTRNRFWEQLTPEQMKACVDEELEFLETVQQRFAALNMQLHPTEYFLFLTDIPTRQVRPYLVQLDKMNESFGKSFGFEEGYNVWRGKAVIVAFMQKKSFLAFERQVLENEDVERAQGICHSYPNGRVVVGCFFRDSPFFGNVLVHETAHGYMHRYRSTVRIPSWINEGIADWVANRVVPSSGEVRERQRVAAGRIRLTGTLGGFFQREPIDMWEYGLASSMIDLLITHDQKPKDKKFRRFFNDIKNGYTWQKSLKRHYEMNLEDLVAAYGQDRAIPGLLP